MQYVALHRDSFDMTSRFDNQNHYGEEGQYIHHNKVLANILLNEIVGSDIISVNSLHHDYVNFEFRDLRISSVSVDGVVEELNYQTIDLE